jgi:hypothetical protein
MIITGHKVLDNGTEAAYFKSTVVDARYLAHLASPVYLRNAFTGHLPPRRKRQRARGSLEVVSTQAIKVRPLPRFEHRTGPDYEQLLYLEREVAARIGSSQPATCRRKPLDLFEAIIVTLIYLRHNTIQAAVGEQARVSQATVSRYIETLEPVVSCCLDCLALDLQHRAARGDLCDLHGRPVDAGACCPARRTTRAPSANRDWRKPTSST